ncbi:MAG: hypothetical protein ACYCZW_01760 [Minisyncoccota bacterium]
MNIKKYVLFGTLGILAFVFVAENPIMFGFCQSISAWGDGTKYCNYSSFDVPEWVSLMSLFLGGSLFILSIITYKMKEEVFRSWWNFARWWAPVIIVVTFLLENASGGGTLGMGNDFRILIQSILYIILVITSLIKIIRTYLKTRK